MQIKYIFILLCNRINDLDSFLGRFFLPDNSDDVTIKNSNIII